MTRLHMIKNLLEPAQLRRLPGFDSDVVDDSLQDQAKTLHWQYTEVELGRHCSVCQF